MPKLKTFRNAEFDIRLLRKNVSRASSFAAATMFRRIGDHLIDATPVKTGLARSNWNAGRRRSFKLNRPVSRTSAKLILRRRIRYLYNTGRGIKHAYIFNNTPYLPQLNRGSSKQAPPDFIYYAVERGYNEAQRYIRNNMPTVLFKGLGNTMSAGKGAA